MLAHHFRPAATNTSEQIFSSWLRVLQLGKLHAKLPLSGEATGSRQGSEHAGADVQLSQESAAQRSDEARAFVPQQPMSRGAGATYATVDMQVHYSTPWEGKTFCIGLPLRADK